jgi:hypothetical protein
MEVGPIRKWTAKRIALLACAMGILAFLGWRIVQALVKDADYRYIFPVVFTIAGISLVATTKPSSRDFMVRNSRGVVLVGCGIIGLAVCWLGAALFYVLAVDPSSESRLFSSDVIAGIFCFLFFVGWMIAFAPKIIRDAELGVENLGNFLIRTPSKITPLLATVFALPLREGRNLRAIANKFRGGVILKCRSYDPSPKNSR